MRFQLVADNPAEEAALSAHPTARVLFDPFLPALQARSIIAATRLGVFESIGHDELTADELSARLGLERDGLELMLRVLVCAGYLASREAGYALTELTSATLLAGSPIPMAGWVEFNAFHWDVIGRLEEVLRTGQGIDYRDQLADESAWRTNQRAMLETARPAAPFVAMQVPVPESPRKLLDVGGSHGLYGAMICRQHPPMRSEVLELPQALKHAQELARQEGIDDVVTHRAGDALVEDLGESTHDVVFLGNLVHHFTAEQNVELLGRLRSALRAGGTVAIWDFKRPDEGSEPDLVGDGMALFFRISSATRCYRLAEYVEWLTSVGFVDVTVHPTPAPAQVLVTGRVV